MLALSAWLNAGEQLVFVARDDARMMAMRDAIARLAPEVETRVFPAWDCLPMTGCRRRVRWSVNGGNTGLAGRWGRQ